MDIESKVKKAWEHFDQVIMAVCMIFLMVLTSSIFLQVVLRFIFSKPLVWVEEVSRYLFIWITFLGSYLVLRKDAHFKVEAVYKKFPRLAAVTNALMIFFFAVLLRYSIPTIKVLYTRLAPATRIPIGVVFSVVIFSCIIMIAELIRKIYVSLKKQREVGSL